MCTRISEQAVSPDEARRRKMFVHAAEIGLTRDERIELAQYLLRRDITSWKELDAGQQSRILDALEGYTLVRDLLAQRPPDGLCALRSIPPGTSA